MPAGAGIAGFILVGGQSRRMGRDKALLPYASETLVQSISLAVFEAAGSVTLLGDPARYGHLGLPVIADLFPGCGPMSGLHAALSTTEAEWNLLVACDLPNLDAAFLRQLIGVAVSHPNPAVRCVAAKGDRGLEPLCAVYHRSIRIEVEQALQHRKLQMRDLVAQLGAVGVEAETRLVRNVNTEEEWRLHLIEKERLS